MAPLSLKLVTVDGVVDAARRQQVDDYFVGEWGYDVKFVDAGMRHIEASLGELSVAELAQTMAEFASRNPEL